MQVEVDTDKQLLRVAKRIPVSADFDPSSGPAREKYLNGFCVPFETGTRFLAVHLIEEVDHKAHALGRRARG